MMMTAKARQLRSFGPLRHVLVVDDNAETRSVLSDYLGGIGYDAQFATSGGRALDLLRAGGVPDVVVCGDWNSGLTVPEFIERLRADAATSDLPVLRMTPEGSSSVAGADGSDASIGSPFRLLELGDKLVRLQDPRR
jgi:CheY-like chemotaxis protein